ncbi:hypothetical protein I3U40_18250 [Mycobacteroides abscessus subsp. abscessus]|uniref:hypothetical protein n=1 Tax=Mycobacteroides abscessus TaxID=36809 RepID=UPI0009A851DD|nr:hypothetical protein [Mycobacteroides abscessus]QSM92998.1 hypothetical protein I3U31_18240 [Mycobacteroides abscessus subsp. abscessus]QSM98036.1 hypothetical protein I3U40_18250 [Mycobacteroides abscessus subsp. abscessus]SLI40837.1 Uncharacterised protein [Mycobacteroides abscessus subsp. abscessus]
MTVAAFVLGLLGTVVAVASLTWQVYTFLMQGARPKLTPIVGISTPDGLAHNDATRDVRESLASAAQQLSPGVLVAGVHVVNAGRGSFHVASWELRTDPGGTAFKTVDVLPGGTAVPCDISPGAEAIFIMELEQAQFLFAASERIEGRQHRMVAAVSSGGRSYRTKPFNRVLLSD